MNTASSFTIGKVTGVHGLNGNLKVWSFAESIDTFCPGKHVLLQSEKGLTKAFVIIDVLAHGKGVLLSLEGVDTRERARDLVGNKILIDRDQLPEIEDGSWYWQDLLGLDVFDHEKGFIGKITHIFPTGANDVLVITRNDAETLVPMHEHFVEAVDMDKRTMRVKLPEEY